MDGPLLPSRCIREICTHCICSGCFLHRQFDDEGPLLQPASLDPVLLPLCLWAGARPLPVWSANQFANRMWLLVLAAPALLSFRFRSQERLHCAASNPGLRHTFHHVLTFVLCFGFRQAKPSKQAARSEQAWRLVGNTKKIAKHSKPDCAYKPVRDILQPKHVFNAFIVSRRCHIPLTKPVCMIQFVARHVCLQDMCRTPMNYMFVTPPFLKYLERHVAFASSSFPACRGGTHVLPVDCGFSWTSQSPAWKMLWRGTTFGGILNKSSKSRGTRPFVSESHSPAMHNKQI